MAIFGRGKAARFFGCAAVVAATFAGPSLAQAPATPAAEAAPVDWSRAAREDVEAAYAAFSARHPGMFDPNNPGFPEQLRRARDAALAAAERARDAEGHMRALRAFSIGLSDGHARAQATYNGRGPVLRPGFTTVWRGDALLVLEPGDSGLSRGARLVGCDGRDARELIRDLAFSFMGRPGEAGQWWSFAPYLFDRVASPYETLPRECEFQLPGGPTATHRLEWRPVPDAVIGEEIRVLSPRDPIALSEPRPGLHRITLSTFSPDEAGRAAFDRLFADLESGMARIAAGRAIVLDLRRNGGGSSSWGEEVAERLWGEAAVRAAQAAYFRDTEIWWLADAANIAHFRSFAERFRAEGRSESADYLDGIVAGLESARQAGNRFYVEDYGAELAGQVQPAEPRRLPPVYVIIDGGCASACLDAVDLFTLFPGVRLIGAPTSADSTYMDILFEPLPSGRGGIVMPTKIWMNRPRASGQVYRPDILVTDLEWTTELFLDRIEADLARWPGRPSPARSEPL